MLIVKRGKTSELNTHIHIPGGKGTEGAYTHNVAGRHPFYIVKGLRQWAFSV